MSQASLALTKALWKVAPSVLTPAQKAKFAAVWAVRKVFGPDAAAPYTPSFSGAPVQHFLVHAGKKKKRTLYPGNDNILHQIKVVGTEQAARIKGQSFPEMTLRLSVLFGRPA